MSEETSKVQKIVWSQAFPFTRLFSTASQSLQYVRLLTALACVIAIAFGGWVLDRFWKLDIADSGVVVEVRDFPSQPQANELEIYVQLPAERYDDWLSQQREAKASAEENLASEQQSRDEAKKAAEKAKKKADKDAEKQGDAEKKAEKPTKANDVLRQELGLGQVDAKTGNADRRSNFELHWDPNDPQFKDWEEDPVQCVKDALEDRKAEDLGDERIADLERHANAIIFALNGKDFDRFLVGQGINEHPNSTRPFFLAGKHSGMGRRAMAGYWPEEPASWATLLQPSVEAITAGDDDTARRWILLSQIDLAESEFKVENAKPTGPFGTLVDYELRCFAGAVQGVCSGRLGFTGDVNSPEPALLGSLASGLKGIVWLVTQHGLFALLFGLLALVILALGGGMICRHAGVQSARDEVLGLKPTLQFAREKWGQLILAPAMPIVIVFGIGIVMLVLSTVLGWLAAIPVLGGLVMILSGICYVLAIAAGVVLAMMLIGFALGLHLMWPRIAVEGSDAFDGFSCALSYLVRRIWHTAYYSLVLLVYGGFCLLFVRLVAMVTLKLTHVFTSAGFNQGASATETIGLDRADAIWSMPAWSELALLPSTMGKPFWGEFCTAPLSFSEGIAAWLIAFWVFIIIALVAAFGLSFFFCGSTQMYFLLRRGVDGNDYDEVYYEEEEDTLFNEVAAEGETQETDED